MKMKKYYCLMSLLVFVFIGLGFGETGNQDDIWARDKLLGNWGGARSCLAENGVTFDFRMSQYYQAITSGGVNTNGSYGGKLDYIMNIDGEKLGLWRGLFINVHAETQFGNSSLADAGAFAFPNTGMMYPLPNYRGTAVTGALFTQALSENFALTAGKINVVDLWTMIYPHTGGGVDGFLNTNMIASALPWFRWVNLSVNGGGALFLTDDRQIKGGVLVFDTQNSSTTTGISDMFDDGTAFLGMWRFFFEKDGMPGSLMFAAGGSTRDYRSLDRSDWGFVPGVGVFGKEKDEAYSAAVYYDQVCWQSTTDPKKHARFYSGWSVSDGDPSFGRSGGFASIEGWGIVPDREKDRMGFGGFYNQLSSDFKRLASPFVRLENLWGIEMYYNAEISKWMHITGDIQLVNNQNRSDNTAVILGVRAVIDF